MITKFALYACDLSNEWKGAYFGRLELIQRKVLRTEMSGRPILRPLRSLRSQNCSFPMIWTIKVLAFEELKDQSTRFSMWLKLQSFEKNPLS